MRDKKTGGGKGAKVVSLDGWRKKGLGERYRAADTAPAATHSTLSIPRDPQAEAVARQKALDFIRQQGGAMGDVVDEPRGDGVSGWNGPDT